MTPGESSLVLLDPHASDEPFPPVEMAWHEPNGLLAFGGDLSPTRLINAYRSGIFPWSNPDEPIYWWSPDPRTVLYPQDINLSRSLRKSIRSYLKKGYHIRFDSHFSETIRACAAPRACSDDTWITQDMTRAYETLFTLGVAHSVEVWNDKEELVGGLYGVSSGGVFSGESMFSKERDTSKMAFVALAWHMQYWGYTLIDCQIENPHLMRMGAKNIRRKEYLTTLKTCQFFEQPTWEFQADIDLSRWQPSER